MKLIKQSVMRPVGVIIAALVMIILGSVSLSGLKVDLMPELDLPIVAVSTPYQGAAPQEVENLVTRPLEGVLSSTEGVSTIQSISTQNQSLILLMFDFNTDLDSVMLDLRDRIDMVNQSLPDGASSPTPMRFDPNQMPIMQIGISADMNLTRLTSIAEDSIIPQIERIPGVASVNLTGGQEREIIVEPDLALLQRYGLTISQLSQIIGGENISAPAGEIERGGQEMALRIVGEFRTVDELENINVPLRTGEIIKLSDVAEVRDTFKENTSYAYVNGEPTLSMDITKQSDANTVEVANAVTRELERLQQNITQGVSLTPIMDSSVFITDSIDSVAVNMLLGGSMALLVLLLFLRSFRSTLIIGLSIPIAVISAFTLLYFAGETINIITLGGLALGIGLLVDNSIVILENIYKFRERGYSKKDAAINGAKEVASAVIASTMTSMVVFVPIVFTDGIASELFIPLALTVGFTLLASLVVSLTIVPMLSGLLLPDLVRAQAEEEQARGIRKIGVGIGHILEKITNAYGKVLKWAINHKRTVVLSTIILLVASLGTVRLVGMELIPGFDQGEISASFETPPGTSLEETRLAVAEIEEYLISLDEVEVAYTTIGGGGMMGQPTGSNSGDFYIRLVSQDERSLSTNDVIRDFSEFTDTLANIDVNVWAFESGGMGGDAISLEVRGDDFETLNFIADDLRDIISDIPGAENITHSMGDTRPEMQLHVNRDLAMQYGLSYAEIMDTVRGSVSGQVASLMRVEGQEIEISVILPEDYRNNFDRLQELPILTQTGDIVPLSAIARFEQVEGPTTITRQNQSRGVSITGDIMDRDLGSVIADIEEELNNYIFPEGYDYNIGGEFEMMMDAFTDLVLALLLAIFLVYAVMAFQFEKVLYPFIVMFSLPATFIGIMIGFLITGRPLSAPAFIGVIMLSGIVVNNAIVLVDYINKLRERDYSREEAIIEAGKTRLRPILMTMLTTVLAMVPLAIGIGEGAELQAPMATVIVFGLSFATLITLLLIPVMYIYTDKFTEWIKGKFGANEANGDEANGDGPR
ncbi:efflux RND transporter permease subunit [Evansella cellulosilytica]|uniref:Acriflavin resistance protein n=1 Tax=Evansella cellulosilytica (strain ATCC 21833 / DSM 2522 / FERM P-1141 / JCM 9156 / N-4) TaxID=649639 RepID=E6TSP3_EVAC2|nr:efflux RND transporter permease subunit [Evansella cellulosilytica]ADU29551.1 acriflavin resistance protein [Evansella cellulosilytica DSM 2522]